MDGLFGGTLGGQRSRRGYYRIQRQDLAERSGISPQRGAPHHRALPSCRPESHATRYHPRRPEVLYHALEDGRQFHASADLGIWGVLLYSDESGELQVANHRAKRQGQASSEELIVP